MREICEYVKLYTGQNEGNKSNRSSDNNVNGGNKNTPDKAGDKVKTLFPILDGFVHGVFITDTFGSKADSNYRLKYKTYLTINDSLMDQTNLTGSILRYDIENPTKIDQYRLPSVEGIFQFLTTNDFTAVARRVFRENSFSHDYYDLDLYVFDKELNPLKTVRIGTYSTVVNPVALDNDPVSEELILGFKEFINNVVLKTDLNSVFIMKSLYTPTLRNILDVKTDSDYIYVLLEDYKSNQLVILDKSLNLVRAKKTKKNSPLYKKLHIENDNLYLFGDGIITILNKNNIDDTVDVITFSVEEVFSLVNRFSRIISYLFDDNYIYMSLGTSNNEHLVIVRLDITNHSMDVLAVISFTSNGYSNVLGYIGDNNRLYTSLSITAYNNTKHHFHFSIPLDNTIHQSFNSVIPNTSNSIEIKNHLSNNGKVFIGTGSFSFDSDTTSSLQIKDYNKKISEVSVKLNKTSLNIDKIV